MGGFAASPIQEPVVGAIDRRDRRHGPFVEHAAGDAPFVHDRDSIADSPAFLRLRHVTQVMTPSAPGQFHNRLSHSWEVARIARGMAQSLLGRPVGPEAAEAAGREGLDATVVEAAALAHDLGHPPFGHDAEDELDQLLRAAGVADGFEANAQTLRIVTRLADGLAGSCTGTGLGMNLTRATLAAILKYPWPRDGAPDGSAKFGAYQSEAAELAWARELFPCDSLAPSVEARLVDWADLVAYATHDFEDFARAGLLPLDRLEADVLERERFLEVVCQRRRIPATAHEDLSEIFDRLLAACPTPRLSPSTRAGRNALRCFCRQQINDAINGGSLVGNGGGTRLQIDPAARLAILLLEGLTWHYVIDTELLKPQRDEQRQIVRELFEALADAANTPDRWDRFFVMDQERLQTAATEGERLRIVADVLASMTEEEATAAAQGPFRRSNPQSAGQEPA